MSDTTSQHVHTMEPTGIEIEWVGLPHPVKPYPWAAGLALCEWLACATCAHHTLVITAQAGRPVPQPE